MGYPGLEDVADRLAVAYEKGNDQGSVRALFLYLLGGKHAPTLDMDIKLPFIEGLL